MNKHKVLSSIPLKVLVFLASLVPAVTGVDRAMHIVLEQGSAQITNWYLQIAACAAVYAVCLVYLLWSSGHKAPDGEVRPGWDAKVPFDLVLAIGIGAGVGLCAMWWEFFDHGHWSMVENHPQQYWNVLYPFYGLGAACLAILHGVLMSFSARIKLGGWWKNTIVFQVLRLAWIIVKMAVLWLLNLLKRIFSAIGRFLAGIPLVWKGVLAALVICLIEFVSYTAIYDHGDRLIFWFVEHLILVPLTLWGFMQMRKLFNGGRALAEGDLAYKIDTSRMVWDFRKHGEDLNSLAAWSAAAAEQKLKSERFKTELITNVSHDIKTPLTSIINYSDLISKEEADSEKVSEYAEVLQRQSVKLKRLLEDLIEASKASTGNLEVNLETCNACTLISQAEGEYREKLDAAGLTLITRMPEEPLYIMADGRRIWRVFDNLMNNVCKHSQAGTRVYLDLAKRGTDAVFTLRNTSREALNISPDELIERFVRGDASRNTEGSGLGLSIAKSFTELQKGTMDIAIDGDLFKVTLVFPAL
jgi:signal transduction histidine kinase